MQKKIKKLVREALEKLKSQDRLPDFLDLDIRVKKTKQKKHGDYTSYIALDARQAIFQEALLNKTTLLKYDLISELVTTSEDVLSVDKSKINILKLAEKIKSAISEIDPSYLKKVEVAKPGFINFFLKDSYFQKQVNKILEEGQQFGSLNMGEGKKVVVEYGQPNTHKLPHVGHFRSYALGESLARLLEFNGYEVFRANYQGDVGLHVAKCLWGYQEKEFKEQENLEDNIKNLQKAYQYGAQQYENDEEAQQEIKELNNKIQAKEKEVKDLWEKTRQWSIDYYEKLQKELGIDYDRLYFESEVSEKAKQIIGENISYFEEIVMSYKSNKDSEDTEEITYPNGYNSSSHDSSSFDTGGKNYRLSNETKETSWKEKSAALRSHTTSEDEQKAIIFPGSEYDLHDRVFITSEGNPTYEAKDLALAFLKKEDFDYDLSLISTASEQIEYFKVVYKALEQIAPELAEKFEHVPFGLISLKGGELSSRKGNIVSIDELLEQVDESLASLVKEKKGNPAQEEISKLVAGACKYSLLKNTPIKDMTFDVKESIDLEGDSGPYLQYTNVRALSILEKEAAPEKFDENLLKEEKELELLKTLTRFPEVVKRATQGYKPNLICNYLFDLAQQFNAFYEEISVLQADQEVKKARLALVKAVNQILENGLYLLAINTPQQM